MDTISFVEQMVEEMVELNPNISHLWPDLKPLQSQNLSEVDVGFSQIWPGNAQHTFLVIEQLGSFIGRQIILDLWRRNNTDIALRRFPVDETGGEDILGNLKISQLPTVAVLSSLNQKNIIYYSTDMQQIARSQYLTTTTTTQVWRKHKRRQKWLA